jgi:hypothetical protein
MIMSNLDYLELMTHTKNRVSVAKFMIVLHVYIVCLFISHQRFIGRTVDLILIVFIFISVLMITIDENTVSLHLATFVDIRINGGMEC